MTPWLLALTLVLPSGYPESVSAARAAMEALDYETARIHWSAAVESARTEEERVEAHLGAGIVARIVEDTTSARLHFLYVLKAQPWRKLTDDTTPKVRTFFEMVRQELDLNSAPEPVYEAAPPPPPQERSLDPVPAPDPVGSGAAPLPPPVGIEQQRTCWGNGLLVLGGIIFVGTYLGGISASFETGSPAAPLGLIPLGGAPVVGGIAGDRYPADTYGTGIGQLLGLGLMVGGWFWTEPVVTGPVRL